MPDCWYIVERQGVEAEVEVWLDEHNDPHAAPGANSIVIGSGASRAVALFDAWQQLSVLRRHVGIAIAEVTRG